MKIKSQRIKIFEDLYRLKEKEVKEKENCFCKGFCRVLHSRFRWKHFKSDHLFEKFKMINESLSKVKCKICDTQFNNEELFKIHVEASHKSSAEFQCDKCDDTFSQKN